MKKLTKKESLFIGVVSILLIGAVTVIKLGCIDNGKAVSCALMPIWFKILILFIPIVFVLGIIFWIVMFVHLWRNNIPNRFIWLIGFLGMAGVTPIIYYFVIKRSEIR